MRAGRFPSYARKILLWGPSVLVAVGMLMVGLSKVFASAPWPVYFEAWGYAPWFRVTVGALQTVGGLSLLVPRFAIHGAVVLIVVMLGAEITELTHDVGFGPVTPLVYLAVLSLLFLLRGRSWRQQRRSERAQRQSQAG